jgi:hypothetical protein
MCFLPLTRLVSEAGTRRELQVLFNSNMLLEVVFEVVDLRFLRVTLRADGTRDVGAPKDKTSAHHTTNSVFTFLSQPEVGVCYSKRKHLEAAKGNSVPRSHIPIPILPCQWHV